MADMTVATTILEQLGGRKFIVMTGAKNLTAHSHTAGSPDTALSFRLPSGFASSGINYVKITLNGLDLYDVEFSRIGRKRQGRMPAVTRIHTETGIYADQLREVFRLHTGLHTSLGIPAAEMKKFHNRHED